MMKRSVKVFGYVDQSLKYRVAKLKEENSRLTESRLIEEGLVERVEFYEQQFNAERR